MRKPVKSILVSIAALALTPLAGAEIGADQFEAQFTYTPSASTTVIYNELEDTARMYCRREGHSVRGLDRFKYTRACRNELMDKVVMKMQMSRVLAFHEKKTGRTMPPAKTYADKGGIQLLALGD